MQDNKAWLESMKGVFEEEVAEGNYVRCQEVIALLQDEGFPAEAKELERLLREETLGTFLTPSDPRLIK